MRLAGKLAAIGVAGAIFATIERGARADDGAISKAECVAANERALGLRREGKLRAARAELVTCGRDECPAIVKADCVAALGDIDANLPTVVFTARDRDGHDRLDLRLRIDDETTDEPVDGRARTLDPGAHTARFIRGGEIVATETVLLRQGEKNRSVIVTIDTSTSTPTPTPTPTPESARAPALEPVGPAPAPTPAPVRVPVVPLVLASVGVVGLGTAGILSLHLDGRVSDLEGSCAPRCSSDQRASLSTELVAANIALGVGFTALAAAVVTYFVTRPSGEGRSR